MNRIDKKLKALKNSGSKAFIAYITAGDQGLTATGKLVLALEGSGVDIVELGIPFSDPLADGPTIRAASQRALDAGANIGRIFNLVRDLRRKTEIPIALMSYYNPVLKYGVGRFFKDCKSSGVDGVILPDLPYEESADIISFARKTGTDTIFLCAPTSTRERIKKIARNSRGFIYYISLTGVTGARKALSEDIAANINKIRSITDKPVAVGFGVSNAAQAAALARISDGVIVGSAIVKIIAKGGKLMIKDVSLFAKKLSIAIHNAR